jgi:hypothetical protein
MTKRFRTTLIVVAIALLSATSWYFVAGHATPAGQPPLASLAPDSFSGFKAEFNASVDRVRLVVLLSPT